MLKALILVGGKSTRMGEPKHLLEREGKPNYQFLIDIVRSCGLKSHISCNQTQAASLESEHPLIVDQYNCVGPIGGIASAFMEEPETSWLVIACDLLNLNKGAITSLVEAVDEASDVVTYQKKGSSFLEATLSIYRPTAAKHIHNAVNSGEYRLQKLLGKCEVKIIEVYDLGFLKNANRRSDLNS